MIESIRYYFDQQIIKVMPGIKPYENDVFGNNDNNMAKSEKYYNLIIAETTPEILGGYNRDLMTVTLDLFASPTNKFIQTFDQLYTNAIIIKDNIINMQNWTDERCFDHIRSNSIIPIEENTNDGAFKMRLNFTVERFYQL